MVSIGEILRNTKAKLVALVGGASAAITFGFGVISTREGIKTGENLSIVWAMFWLYVVWIIVLTMILANIGTISKLLRAGATALVARWRALPAGLPTTRKRLFYAVYILFAAACLGLTFAIAWNVYWLAAADAKYFLRLANQDFRNRQMVLARQYMQSYQVRDAARVYAYVRDRYQDDAAAMRLDEVEKRFRLFTILSDISDESERMVGPTPNTAYRKVATYLLSPFEPDTKIPLTQYLGRYNQVLEAQRTLDLWCSSGVPKGTAKRTVISTVAQIVEPEFVHLASNHGPDPMPLYCTARKSGAFGKAMIDEQWQAVGLIRLAALRRAAMHGSIVCPEALPGNLGGMPDPVPIGETQVSEEGSEPLEAGGELGGSEEVKPSLSAYAKAQYACRTSEPIDAKPSVFVRVFRFFVPSRSEY